MQNLNKIAKTYGTDKSSDVHDYCIKYEKWLPFNRLEPLKLLEIGVLDGASIRTWKEYYPNSTVVGIDINPDCIQSADSSKDIMIEIGSQIDLDFLNDICNKYGPFDMILDDGSHVNHHIITSMTFLLDHVKSEGLYIIEDSCTSYWEEYEGGFRKPGTSIEFCKLLVDDVNFNGIYSNRPGTWYMVRKDEHLINTAIQENINIRLDIESINFLNSIIIITKR